MLYNKALKVGPPFIDFFTVRHSFIIKFGFFWQFSVNDL